MATNYGSLDGQNAKYLPGAKSSALKVSLSTVVLTAITSLLIVLFGGAAVNIIVGVVVVVYVFAFAAFCYTAVPFASNAILVPFIAINMQLQVVYLLLAFAARGFKPAFPQWTLAYELTVMMMRFAFADYGHLVGNKNAHLLRMPFHLHGKFIPKSNSRLHGTVPEKLEANGMEHMWLRDDPHQDQADPQGEVPDRASVDVLLANYRMAPQFLYPTALNDCFAMYKYVLEKENIAPNHVVLSGDSASGEMTLTNCMRLRDTTPELKPAAALCYSPLVDLGETGGDDITPHCLLAANFLDNSLETYLSSIDDPNKRSKVSPINQNLKDLPPAFVQFGTLERFYEQGLRFKANADSQGVKNMELDLLENIAHDPVMLPTAVSPATEDAIHKGCAFAAKHLAPILKA
ncbi:unnamed protein product [Phytophthora fragariaefolia]|uniref:Unnamed protein product n=1 Tax=Phytophthora fragariaefolia TaxID=1490495 RepID=A0A9W7D066_9STRA|nr:unnamed protein product [Phytophthora fragariaefolia]